MRTPKVEKPWRPGDVNSGMHNEALFIWHSDGIEKDEPQKTNPSKAEVEFIDSWKPVREKYRAYVSDYIKHRTAEKMADDQEFKIMMSEEKRKAHASGNHLYCLGCVRD